MQSLPSQQTWFIFKSDQILVVNDNVELKLPDNAVYQSIETQLTRHHSLGLFNNRQCFCAEIEADVTLPPGLEFIHRRKAFDKFGNDWFVAAAKAYSIINWDKNHQYCGKCANITKQNPGGFERVCTNCGLVFYPRISPSVIVRIRRGDEILVARSPHFTPGAYGLIAGFLEPGESIEDAVHREVLEEVNITIKNLKYYGSQSWPFPDSLMVAFTADYAGGELTLDPKEIEAAGWYTYDKLPGMPSTSITLSYKLIEDFINEQTLKHGKANGT